MTRRWGGCWTDAGWTLNIWAPLAGKVALILNGSAHPMVRQADGFWTVTVPARAGDTYLLRVDGQDIPDPASRLQSGDVHSPSVVTEPAGDRGQAP